MTTVAEQHRYKNEYLIDLPFAIPLSIVQSIPVANKNPSDR